MLFRDYQWTVQVPSLHDVSAFLSPPPGATIGSGRWWKYPGGYATGPFGPLRGGTNAPHSLARAGSQTARGNVSTASASPGAPSPGSSAQSLTAGLPRKTVQVPAYGGVPPWAAIYAWRPNTGTSQALNGYLVYGTGAWYVDLARAAGSLNSDVMTTGKGATSSGFNLFIQNSDLPPPPSPVAGTPAATVVSNAGSGAKWKLKHPGLLVWMGASNANEADLQQLSAPVTLQAPAPAAPAAGAPQVLAAGAPSPTVIQASKVLPPAPAPTKTLSSARPSAPMSPPAGSAPVITGG
jgi:hypothetical protein